MKAIKYLKTLRELVLNRIGELNMLLDNDDPYKDEGSIKDLIIKNQEYLYMCNKMLERYEKD